MMPPFSEWWKAAIASTGAIVASIGALEAEAVMTEVAVTPVAYVVAVVLSLGTGIATYFKGNAEPEEDHRPPEPTTLPYRPPGT